MEVQRTLYNLDLLHFELAIYVICLEIKCGSTPCD
jgi:hypothetical protein